MAKKLVVANWKMNTTLPQALKLVEGILGSELEISVDRSAVLCVPFPYLSIAHNLVADMEHLSIGAQNCYIKVNGAYTGEVSVEMLQSLDVRYVIIGHSERREYFGEDGDFLAKKIRIALEYGITPIFCCGEPLEVRNEGKQDAFVANQLDDSLSALSPEDAIKLVVAYEPIWAIGTGKTASSSEAEAMHKHIREHLAVKFGKDNAVQIPILYGGSVKGSNAKELFAQENIDGGLVGGASLSATEFVQIVNALPK